MLFRSITGMTAIGTARCGSRTSGFSGKPCWTWAVSYTHLDVYKRQVLFTRTADFAPGQTRAALGDCAEVPFGFLLLQATAVVEGLSLIHI